MDTKQRRERERHEIRQAILSAARQIAIEEGWQAVATRKVAERIEYSRPSTNTLRTRKQFCLLCSIKALSKS